MRIITPLLFGLVILGVVGMVIVSRGEETLISPVLINSKNVGLNQWFPRSDLPITKVLGIKTTAPQINAKAALFLDTKTGQVFFSKNIHQRLPIASLVKVMTAVVALGYRDLDDEFTVSEIAVGMEPDKMLLIAKEKLTLKELLYGMFLVSANDAAEVLAEGSTGRREEFIAVMNAKAAQLGMKDSFFANPTGLDEDQNNSYSSVYDLAVLARFAIKTYPFLIDVSSTEHIVLPKTDNHQDYDMYSGINLLTTYPGVVGFKTGFTPEAGLTLITLARKNNREVLGVILGSENRREEARELLDWSFAQMEL